MLKKIIPGLAVAILFSYQALALPVNLGAAGPGNWAVLQAGDGKIDVNAGGPVNGITGNVGVNGPGKLSLTGGSFVHGNVLVSTNTATQISTSGGSAVSGA